MPPRDSSPPPKKKRAKSMMYTNQDYRQWLHDNKQSGKVAIKGPAYNLLSKPLPPRAPGNKWSFPPQMNDHIAELQRAKFIFGQTFPTHDKMELVTKSDGV